MKTKKIVADNMPEAMMKVRHELGKDAVILHSKKISAGGWMGLFKKTKVEVVATVDPYPAASKKNNAVKKSISQLDRKKSVPQVQVQKRPEFVSQQSSQDWNHRFPAWVASVEHALRHTGFSETHVASLIEASLKRWYTEEHAQADHVKTWINDQIRAQLSTLSHGPVQVHHRIVQLIGPTGVGKTTTLAKLAAHCVLQKKQSVGFITFDTYRIAAIDQLKTYADILNAPVEVVYEAKDVSKAVERFHDKDVIFIDTAGRNYRDGVHADELQSYLVDAEDAVTYLVLSLTSKYEDMKKIYGNFHNIPIHKFIFTKKDETSCYGSMFNMMIDHQLGAAYVTHGQDVPEDILSANVEQLASLLAVKRE
ncbi:flagellar biosynthesis protein FlhF [Bacillaceae bacterium SIJ1]|uniref:flagellar biosynthesis protein FlhF n=1 Tax=Litoribacterium kuwaitense TaxID=1398745 RepID=UPI0013EAC525|nr:flagellar biosynthesis protein FlhF [Litoribacterium kuwaitense]NGP44109.1 flagellar biosynthesis protein FlhF [Litoribacterium kuwaitense]